MGDPAQDPAERVREPDVRDEAVSEERAHAPPGAIEELIRNHDVQRLVLFLEAAHRARRQNPLDAERFEAIDVRAKIELGRENAVTDTVPWQKFNP